MTAPALEPDPVDATVVDADPSGGPVVPAAPAASRLPVTMYILAGLILTKAVLIGLIVLGATYEPLLILARTSATYLLLEPLLTNTYAMAFMGLVALLLAFAAISLLRRRRVGWLLAMVLTGVFVAVDIYGFLNTTANHLWMLLNILTVFYLNQSDVRETVGAARRDANPMPVVIA
jgi:hypothetical protein